MNRSSILELLKIKRLYFDGGTGTVLQSRGLCGGTAPEIWNIEHPNEIIKLHNEYLDAGCDIIKTNTFGINSEKYDNYKELIIAAISCAKKAVAERHNKFIAFDIGPTGRLLCPFGDLPFETAVSIFSDSIKVAAECGVDLILIETMNDCLETKAAVVAAKENCDLPIFVTNAYDESGKLMTGADPEAMIAMLEGLGVSALGMNCSFGPDKMLDMIDIFVKNSSLPIIVNPNAGLPTIVNGKTRFSSDADHFSDIMIDICTKGGTILGGCCGTTPEYIRKTVEKTRKLEYSIPTQKNSTVISSYTHAVKFSERPLLIGERINPTGKPKLKEALKNSDMSYIMSEAVSQSEKSVHILDVNVGLPGIDEEVMMHSAINAIMSCTDIPLQIDSSSSSVIEKAARVYAGKPMINSVNGKEESMNSVFPIVKKYGAVVVALTMDEDGIPDTVEGRVSVAERILSRAHEFGISSDDIVFDPLALTVSSGDKNALITLGAVKELSKRGYKTILGVSNISFGLPAREKINSAFLSCAFENGLSCAIMNPFSERMMDAYYSHIVLHGMDEACDMYIRYANECAPQEQTVRSTSSDEDLYHAVLHGFKEKSIEYAKKLIKTESPLDIIDRYIIPALDETGKNFELKKTFLPQLLMCADAASAAFEIIKETISKSEIDSDKKVILATVKGDIHDIGKNIVKTLLESYGYTVIDLGRDVAESDILESVISSGCKLVGLSALMTTTVPSMEGTIKLLRENVRDIKIMVGGAVLNKEYADMIGADYYGEDAMASVRIADNYYKSLNKEEKQ